MIFKPITSSPRVVRLHVLQILPWNSLLKIELQRGHLIVFWARESSRGVSEPRQRYPEISFISTFRP